MEIIDDINKTISWLESNIRNTNLPVVSEHVNRLAIQCYHFSDVVANAYDVANTAESEYKYTKAMFIKNFQGSVTGAQNTADADEKVREAKVLLTEAENTYNRLKLYLGEFRNILDCFRQRVSVERQVSTNLGYQT